MAITINNFPPNGSTGELRTVAFGPTGPMRVLLDVDVDEDGNFDIDLTVSNAAKHSELKEFLGDVIELLKMIVEESDFEANLNVAIENDNYYYPDDEEVN